jgi:hypothetical protein
MSVASGLWRRLEISLNKIVMFLLKNLSLAGSSPRDPAKTDASCL